jgi:hypothetical protein
LNQWCRPEFNATFSIGFGNGLAALAQPGAHAGPCNLLAGPGACVRRAGLRDGGPQSAEDGVVRAGVPPACLQPSDRPEPAAVRRTVGRDSDCAAAARRPGGTPGPFGPSRSKSDHHDTRTEARRMPVQTMVSSKSFSPTRAAALHLTEAGCRLSQSNLTHRPGLRAHMRAGIGPKFNGYFWVGCD